MQGVFEPVIPASRRPPTAIVALSVCALVATVTFGELSPEAMLAVSAVGIAVLALALHRRSGSAAAPVGRAGFVWLAWVVAALLWELLTFVQNSWMATFSDLMDPALAHPALRGVATVGWAVAGCWLLARPSGKVSEP